MSLLSPSPQASWLAGRLARLRPVREVEPLRGRGFLWNLAARSALGTGQVNDVLKAVRRRFAFHGGR